LKALLGHPVRTRTEPLKFHGIARCPVKVLRTKEERAEWKRIASILGPAGMCTPADQMLMTMWCANVARWLIAKSALNERPVGPSHPCAHPDCQEPTWERYCVAHGGAKASFGLVAAVKGKLIENPFLKIAERCETQLMRLANEFGLSPLGRQRLCMPLLGGTAPAPHADDLDIAETFFEAPPMTARLSSNTHSSGNG
jgi:P27 family predicted phage terminase small subunit